jgi:hypothetical protein
MLVGNVRFVEMESDDPPPLIALDNLRDQDITDSTGFSGKVQAVDIIGFISPLIQEKNVVETSPKPRNRGLSRSHL